MGIIKQFITGEDHLGGNSLIPHRILKFPDRYDRDDDVWNRHSTWIGYASLEMGYFLAPNWLVFHGGNDDKPFTLGDAGWYFHRFL